jgi:iron complex transport system substrate-binding protein
MTRAFAAALAWLALAGAALAEPPERVVSINLCTDQLALLVAGEGQLVSVSRFAADPGASNLPEAAARLVPNAGSAEQVFLLAPDLVLADAYDNPATLDMLRRLGIRVELFSPIETLEGVSAALLRMGRLLGREARAREVVAAYEAELARLAAAAEGLPRERAAFFYANSYTSGAGTLAEAILDRAGLANAARERGLAGSARLPLEVLVRERPFLVRTTHISGRSPALAYAPLGHPALEALAADGRSAVIEERWQVCGTPFVTRAIAALLAARRGEG